MNKLKLALIGVALSFGVINAKAGQEVYDVSCSSYTSFSVTVGSTTGTSVALFTASVQGLTTSFFNILPDRKYIELQNLDASSNTLCAVDAVTSTVPANWTSYSRNVWVSSTVGHVIQANGGTWKFSLPATNAEGQYLVPWCMNANAGRTSSVSVNQCGSRQ